MRTFYHLLGDVLRVGPCDPLERLTPVIIAVLGALILAVMFYAWIGAFVAA